ncbi:MAG: hypothetical protein WC205_04320 [Opitutaceae bacterium]
MKWVKLLALLIWLSICLSSCVPLMAEGEYVAGSIVYVIVGFGPLLMISLLGCLVRWSRKKPSQQG